MKMQGNAPVAPMGKLSALEKALSKKMKPMKTVKAMPNKVSKGGPTGGMTQGA